MVAIAFNFTVIQFQSTGHTCFIARKVMHRNILSDNFFSFSPANSDLDCLQIFAPSFSTTGWRILLPLDRTRLAISLVPVFKLR